MFGLQHLISLLVFGGILPLRTLTAFLLVRFRWTGERPDLGVEWRRRKIERTREQRGLLGGNGAFLRP